MKMNKEVRRAGVEHFSSEKVKGKLPEKKEKNAKNSIFSEIDDEEVDYRSLIKKEDSILSYYDDNEDEDDDYDDEDEYDEDEDDFDEDDFEDEDNDDEE